jgi:DNA-directed RNA polymerase specialized sigma54-like protein
MLKQNLQLKLGQKLAPQQIQLMKLIQLHTLEFEEELERELEENPALEKVADENLKKNIPKLMKNMKVRATKVSKQILMLMSIFTMTNQAIKPQAVIIPPMMKNLTISPF